MSKLVCVRAHGGLGDEFQRVRQKTRNFFVKSTPQYPAPRLFNVQYNHTRSQVHPRVVGFHHLSRLDKKGDSVGSRSGRSVLVRLHCSVTFRLSSQHLSNSQKQQHAVQWIHSITVLALQQRIFESMPRRISVHRIIFKGETSEKLCIWISPALLERNRKQNASNTGQRKPSVSECTRSRNPYPVPRTPNPINGWAQCYTTRITAQFDSSLHGSDPIPSVLSLKLSLPSVAEENGGCMCLFLFLLHSDLFAFSRNCYGAGKTTRLCSLSTRASGRFNFGYLCA